MKAEQIHEAEAEMAPRLAALKLEVASEMYGGLLRGQDFEEWLAYYCTGTQLVEFMHRRSYFYAGESHHPDGMVGVEMDGDGCRITDLYVRTDLHCRGVGSALLERALDWGREHGALWAVIDLFAGNGAGLAFVAKHGFRAAKELVEERSHGKVIRHLRLLADASPG